MSLIMHEHNESGCSDGKTINSRILVTPYGSDLRALHVTVIYSGILSVLARVYGLTESRVNLLIANSAVINGNNELIHFFTALRYIVA